MPTPAQAQYNVILERLELLHGLVATVNNLDKSISLLEQSQQRFIESTAQEFSGMCIRVDKLVTKIETLENEQIKESKRIDSGQARVDELLRNYGVTSSRTEESVKRINGRIDQLEKNVNELTILVKMVVGVCSFIGFTAGGWVLGQLLGLIK